eukprot:5968597-Pyramimonas_sp.AAC.1
MEAMKQINATYSAALGQTHQRARAMDRRPLWGTSGPLGRLLRHLSEGFPGALGGLSGNTLAASGPFR